MDLGLKDTPFLSPIMRDYFAQTDNIKPFYTTHPSTENWQDTIENCLKNYAFSRETLKEVLEEQYKKNKVEIGEKVKKNLNLLLEKNTLTVCTGHQLNILTGPLFSILKVIQTLRLAEDLQKKYPEQHFVPVYWMATEDHDWAEINHFYCFDKNTTWDKNTNRQPVGKISLSDFENFEEKIRENLSAEDFAHPIVVKIIEIYKQAENLAAAHQGIFNYFFAEKGLVIIDADHPKLKKVIELDIAAELAEQGILKNIENKGFPYPFQATPRNINLFYVENTQRERVEKKESNFILLPSEKTLKLNENISENIQNFSPNVLLRTVYQQKLLPNLCYIGGHAEMSYWLQMKPHFDAIKLFFPILVPRITALILKEKDKKKLDSWGITMAHFLEKSEYLAKEITQKELAKNIDFSYSQAQEKIQAVAEQIKIELQKIDATLVPRLEGEKTKFIGQIENLYDKMQKAQKQKLEIQLGQLQKIIDYILPHGHLREREMNVLELVLKNKDQNIVDYMYKNLMPLAYKRLLVLDVF